MLDHKTIRRAGLLLAVFLAAGSLVLAGPRKLDQKSPHRYNPRSLDGALVTLTNPTDGRLWSAWAYRDGAEYDIAVSFQGITGFWSEPVFIGRDDRRDQVEPALAADAAGTLYLVYADRGTGAVMLTSLPGGSDGWAEPLALTEDGQRGSMPAVSVAGDRLVVAYRSGRSIRILDLPLFAPPSSTHGVQDNPDPYGYTPPEGGINPTPGTGSGRGKGS